MSGGANLFAISRPVPSPDSLRSTESNMGAISPYLHSYLLPSHIANAILSCMNCRKFLLLRKLHRQDYSKSGFTIVELLVVIVVIGILAAITIVSYTGITQKAGAVALTSDLSNTRTVFEMYNVTNGSYPTDISTTTAKASKNVVLQSAVTSGGRFCVNAYSLTDPTLRKSWDSVAGLQDGLCDGVTIGSPIGGTVPLAARGINLVPDFSRWTLSNGATYNTVTRELSLGVNGSAVSPLVRVDRPAVIDVGGDLYATTASPNSLIAPKGGYQTGTNYYASDGVTPVMNSDGYTGNGCAHDVNLSTWNLADTRCVYTGGSLVVYMQYNFIGSWGGNSSPDLKVRSPLLTVSN